MKRLILPLILVVLFTSVLFVSCKKEEVVTETETETVEEVTSETTTTTKKQLPTFKTVAPTSSTEFKGTPVIYPTTSSTTKATTTTTKKETTTTTALTTAATTPTSTTKGADQNYDDPDAIDTPLVPMDSNDSGDTTLINFLTEALG